MNVLQKAWRHRALPEHQRQHAFRETGQLFRQLVDKGGQQHPGMFALLGVQVIFSGFEGKQAEEQPGKHQQAGQ